MTTTAQHILRPNQKPRLLPLSEVLEFRDLLRILALRDVRLRYRQTAIGVTWVVLQPLLGAGLLTFVFGRVAGFSTGSKHVPYFVFSLAGLLVWNVFIQILQKASDSLVSSAQLVSKIYFPRIVLPASVVLGVLIDFAVGMVVLASLLVAYGLPPTVALIALPAAVVLAVLLGLGFGLGAAALNVSFRDVRYVIPVVSQFLLYAAPVAYSVAEVPSSARWVMEVNPMVGVLELFRWAVLGTPPPSVLQLVVSGAMAVTILLLGAYIFQVTERRFADVI
jgi:lipopolysaccharide transport system permease protein